MLYGVTLAQAMNPQQVGRYEIPGLLGQGGMATVHRAYDPDVAREVPLKLIRPEFATDPQFRARFEREARAVATLEYASIVPIYDYGREGEQHRQPR